MIEGIEGFALYSTVLELSGGCRPEDTVVFGMYCLAVLISLFIGGDR